MGVLRGDADRTVGAAPVLDVPVIEEGRGPAGAILGAQGRDFFRRHYTWPAIERKYKEMFDRLTKDTHAPSMEPLPSFFKRLRRDLPPAATVVDKLPSGPAVR